MGAGATVYPHLLFTALAKRGWTVDVLAFRPLEGKPWLCKTPVPPSYVRRCHYPWRVRLGSFALGGRLGFHLSTRQEAVIRNWCAAHPEAPVAANMTQLARWLSEVPENHGGERVALTHEVIHERAAAFAAAGAKPDFEILTREEEIALLRHASRITAIQRDDGDALGQLVGRKNVSVLPPPFPPRPLPDDRRIPGRCLFVGGKAKTNQAGLRWFLGHCWQEIRRAVPQATLEVCGSVGECLEPPLPPGVHAAGRVPDLEPSYAAAEVCLAPLRFGSGVKLKLLEAAAFGRAVVSTSTGLQGLAGWDDGAAIRADDPQAFAAAVVRLLSSEAERRQRAEKLLALLRKEHDPDRVAERFESCLLPKVP